jgi:imidazolonepropionase
MFAAVHRTIDDWSGLVPERRPVDLLIYRSSEMLTVRPDAADLVGRVVNGAVAIAGERIVSAGPLSEIERQFDLANAQRVDAGGGVVMPGFVDCHTHVVWGGTRVDEWVTKLTGGDLDALRARGLPVGIVGTTRDTRKLSVEQMVEAALPRLREMLAYGTTTVESKSGYGLTVESELAMLRANRELARLQPADIVSTFLGGHAVPPDVPRERYIASIIEEMTPRVVEEGLAEFTDVYTDAGYFSLEESRRILEAGVSAGLMAKIHLDQYQHTEGGIALIAELGGVSADHLNYTTPDELRQLASAGVVAVPLPALDFSVGHPRPVDIQTMLASGVTVALATDICPGAWVTSMQFVINLACRLHRMSPAEAVRASTLNAARAISRQDEIGSLEPGKLADIVILDVERHEDLAYRLGRNAVRTVIKRGRIVHEREGYA